LPELRLQGEDVCAFGEAMAENAALAHKLKIREALSRAASRTGRARVILLVDQLEELFTHPAISEASRHAFVRAVQALAESGDFWVLATVRSDFYAHLQAVPELGGITESCGWRA
jgi:hypothetical protein